MCQNPTIPRNPGVVSGFLVCALQTSLLVSLILKGPIIWPPINCISTEIQAIVIVVQSLGRVRLFLTPWIGSSLHEFSRQEYWRGLPFLLQRIFPTPGSNPCLLRLLNQQVGSLPPVLVKDEDLKSGVRDEEQSVTNLFKDSHRLASVTQ